MRATNRQPRFAEGKTKEAKSGDAAQHLATVADAKRTLLLRRADALASCTENSPEETELAAIVMQFRHTRRSVGHAGKIPGIKD